MLYISVPVSLLPHSSGLHHLVFDWCHEIPLLPPVNRVRIVAMSFHVVTNRGRAILSTQAQHCFVVVDKMLTINFEDFGSICSKVELRYFINIEGNKCATDSPTCGSFKRKDLLNSANVRSENWLSPTV